MFELWREKRNRIFSRQLTISGAGSILIDHWVHLTFFFCTSSTANGGGDAEALDVTPPSLSPEQRLDDAEVCFFSLGNSLVFLRYAEVDTLL